MNDSTHQGQGNLRTGRDILAYYANEEYTVEDVTITHPIPEDRPKRNEVTIELTLREPLSSALDRMEEASDSSQ